MESEQPRKRSGSVGAKLTLREAEDNPLLLPQPPHLSRDLQKEWLKAHGALHNLDMARGEDNLGAKIAASKLPKFTAPQGAQQQTAPRGKAGAKASGNASSGFRWFSKPRLPA